MIKPEILARGNFSSNNIEIRLNPISNRLIDPEFENQIDAKWESILKAAHDEGKLLYDGDNFRLDNVTVSGDKLILEISKIKYKVRNSLSKLRDQMEKLGKDYYANGLAIGGFIKAKDNKYIFGKRSGKTVTSNTEDFIGGIFEPMVIENGEDLFNYNFKEIKEETGLDKEHISAIKLIALILTPSTNVILLTSSQLNIDSAEVTRIFEETNDQFEMSELLFIGESELIEYLRKLGGYKEAVIELLQNNPI